MGVFETNLCVIFYIQRPRNLGEIEGDGEYETVKLFFNVLDIG